MEKTPYLFVFADQNSPEDRQRNTFVGLGADAAAPVLVSQSRVKPNHQKLTELSPDAIDLINIVKDFEWTHTPAAGRREVPFIRLSEYRVNFNSLLQNIRYLLSFARDAKSPSRPTDQPSGVSSAVNKIAAFFQSTMSKVINTAPLIEKLAVDAPSELNQSPYLHPYYGLYGASPTGFNYYFPYFEETWKSVGTNWGDVTDGGGIFSPIIKDLFDTDGISKSLGSLQINPNILGTYIERPKMYSYGGGGEPETTFTVTLLNTNSFEDVIRNWHLCFLLSYQNLPNKTSKVFLEPPVIYEVEVPGVFYSPFAYIKSLKITNLGSTRTVEIPYLALRPTSTVTGNKSFNDTTSEQARWDNYSTDKAPRKSNENSVKVFNPTESTEIRKVETIVPEAYKIDITVQSLVPESKNLFYHSILGIATLNSGIYTATIKDPSMREAQGFNPDVYNPPPKSDQNPTP